MSTPEPEVVRDWLLERGYSPERVALMLGVEDVVAALDEIRPLCVECGDHGTRQFSTEGDGNYWLCDSVDLNHAIDRYAGEPIPQPALRIFLGKAEPELCECVDHAQADGNCRDCLGSGWVVEATA